MGEIQVMPPPCAIASALGHVSEPGSPGLGTTDQRHCSAPVSGSWASIGSPKERTEITVKPNGVVDVVIGTQPSGQGHETSFAQVVSDLLGVPVEKVEIILGDTDVVRVGGGSHSGRSMRHAATLFSKGAADLIDKGRRIAAAVLETSPDRIAFTDGRFVSRDTNRNFDVFERLLKILAPQITLGEQCLHFRHRL